MNKYTIAFMIFWVVIALAVDLFFAKKWGERGTISWQLVNLSHRWLIIPFLIGVLMGHFFWRLQVPPDTAPAAPCTVQN